MIERSSPLFSLRGSPPQRDGNVYIASWDGGWVTKYVPRSSADPNRFVTGWGLSDDIPLAGKEILISLVELLVSCRPSTGVW